MNASRFSRPLVALGSLVALSVLFTGTEARANRYGQSSHAPLPLLGTDGGPILSTAKIVPIYYSADPLASDIAAYFAKLSTSAYVGRTVAQYGVTSLSVAPAIAISDAPPASIIDTDIASWLLAEIAAGALPAPDSTTAYQVVYPATTVVNQGGLYGYTYQSCQEYVFDATDSTGSDIPFGVVPLCEGFSAELTDIQSDTFQSTANIANVVTNADVIDAPAYQDPSWSGSAWGTYGGLSLGTMCGISPSESSTTPTDLGYLAARIWSNAGAAKGSDPCPTYDSVRGRVPYFNAAPDIEGGTVLPSIGVAKGLILPLSGGSVTIPVRLFADGEMGAWNLSATERTDLDGQSAAHLSFKFDQDRGRAGDVRYLTITRAAEEDGGLAYPGEAIPLVFEIDSNTHGTTHAWFAIVGNE
jgi:hypothetical protein